MCLYVNIYFYRCFILLVSYKTSIMDSNSIHPKVGIYIYIYIYIYEREREREREVIFIEELVVLRATTSAHL